MKTIDNSRKTAKTDNNAFMTTLSSFRTDNSTTRDFKKLNRLDMIN